MPAPLWDVFRLCRPCARPAYSKSRNFFNSLRHPHKAGIKSKTRRFPPMSAGIEGASLGMLDSQDRGLFEQLWRPLLDAALNLSRWLRAGPADAAVLAP